MNTTIKISGVEYPVISINGKLKNVAWDERQSKEITLKMSILEVCALFKDGVAWSIVEHNTKSTVSIDDEGNIVYDENGEIVMFTEEYTVEYDNSEYNVLGDIVIHTDGTCTVAMGKSTDLEDAYEILYGGNK